MSNTNHSLTRGSIAAKAAALLTAAALGLTGFALTGGNAASAAETTPTAATAAQSQEDTPFDYYAGIPDLPSDHVFENITLERLEDILRYGKGNFVILIGGTWDSATTAALPAINTAAKAQGIEKIYNFDPHLDNAGADTLVNINDKNNAVDAFAKRFQQTIDEFGLTDLQSKNTANVVDLPTLFTYNKDNTGDKVPASTANVADSAELTRVLGTAKNAATRTNGQFYTNYYLNNVSAGTKPSRKIVVAGNEPLSRTGAEATVIASVALSLALTAAGALALSRNRGDAAAAQALSDSTRPTSAR